jgi:hypothetical protein
MTAIFKLYNLKAKNRWRDKSFDSLLDLLREMLPEKNELPESTYKARRMLCPLSMEAEKIPVCRNDCILFRGEHVSLNKCSKYNASRYKPKVDEIECTKGVPVKVIWYLPILFIFRRLFSNPKYAKLMKWHVKCRKDDDMLRHPADITDMC